ncbi:MAG: cytochrome P450 [Acidobacteria bacterium]|nr:cytochrome P450 [Acidobacteriota bacterium]
MTYTDSNPKGPADPIDEILDVWGEDMEGLMGFEPQPKYRALQDEDPAKVIGHRVRLLGMQEILEVTKHHDVVGNGGNGPTMGAKRPLIPLDIDGPEHTKFRKILDPVFSPKRVALLEPQVRARCGELIDAFIDAGKVDAVAAFTVPLPTTIFLSIMGIPLDQLDYFLAFKDGILRTAGDMTLTREERIKRTEEASAACYAFFDDELAARHRRDDPGDDLIGALMKSEVDGHRLTDENIQDISYLLMIAGLDTVTSSLGCILSWLARHPEGRQWVTADPSRWPLAIEELMRFESPVPGGSRFAAKDVVINGKSYPAGTEFSVSWSAANLDPAFFDDPLTVNLERQPNRHIDFASGWHRCLGSHLARLELRLAMEEWHARIPDYEIEPGAEVPYLPLGVRQPLSLPLVWQ